MTARHLALALAFFLLGLGPAAKAQNLVPDPSFEADAPSWFVEDGSPSYVAEKRVLAPREGGQTVLAISAWATQGAQVSSLPFAVRAGAVSATACVRLLGDQPVDAELYLVDEKGEHLTTFFKTRIAPGVSWRRLNATSSLATSADVRLVLAVTGPSRGAHLELDDVGLFESRQPSLVSDTSHFEWFDGETLAGQSPAWRSADHFPSWYHEFPIGGRMLNGAGPVAPQDNKPAVRRVQVRAAGTYVLWTRFLRTNAANRGAFSVEIVQDGKRAGVLDVADDSAATFGGAELEWVFAPLRVRLIAGTAEIVLRRPAVEVSWVARKIDMFVLTNLAYFTPQATDFRTHGFVRFVNEGNEGFCLFADLRRHQGPTWHVHRMWTGRAPLRAYNCPADQRIEPSRASAWVRISDDLSPALDRNNLSLIATTGSHTTGLYRGRLRGRLEFATSARRDMIKTVELDQNTPRVLLTVGASFDANSIRTSEDYLAQEERRAAEVQPSPSEPARHLDLSVILSGVHAELDPSSLVERELAVVRRLGFNSSNTPITTPAATAEFNRKHNLRHAGAWAPSLNLNDTRAPADRRKIMAEAWRKFASDYGSSLAALDHVKLLDEPHGSPLAAMLPRAEDFRAWLRGLGLSPAAFRRKQWNDVSLRVEVDRVAHPREFYWSSMYRLHALANDIRVAMDAKRDA
ncbi:MAG TPA: hypothetical protein VFX59_24545, partial [Polyangiales bacterium]|nr:hypothetical protein [Polyangiales bacterium]